MMGQLNHDQGEFFYSFRLDEAIPDDHPVRAIAGVLDLSWVRSELAPFYPKMGRPSVDPVLMIRMDYQNFDDYWAPIAAGEGPLGKYVATVDTAERVRIDAPCAMPMRPVGPTARGPLRTSRGPPGVLLPNPNGQRSGLSKLLRNSSLNCECQVSGCAFNRSVQHRL